MVQMQTKRFLSARCALSQHDQCFPLVISTGQQLEPMLIHLDLCSCDCHSPLKPGIKIFEESQRAPMED